MPRELIDVRVDYFFLRMKDGKYNIYKRTAIDAPRVITDVQQSVDTKEEAISIVQTLNENIEE